jgi:osmotically-inducible protein OsmY
MIISTGLTLSLLSGCASTALTAASMVYDRHSIYHKVSDFRLNADINRALYRDKTFKWSDRSVTATVFNQDVLLVGHVPERSLRQEAESRVNAVGGYRRLFNYIQISSGSFNGLLDSWITTRVRSMILADSEIDPKAFKVVTSDQVVYLMGDVMSDQSNKVVDIARRCDGVRRVVKLFQYYHLTDHV